jgi:hypothetical protein
LRNILFVYIYDQAIVLQASVRENPALGFTLILQLTGMNGSRMFDQLTKTKTVDSILSSMDAEGIRHYVDYLLKQVNDAEGWDYFQTYFSCNLIFVTDQG